MKGKIMTVFLAAYIFAASLSLADEADSTQEKIEEVKGKVEAMEEPFLGLQSDVAGLKKIKLTGYMQVRFDYADSSQSALNNEAKNSAISSFGNNFYIRRARLKVTYQPSPLTSKYVFYFNFGRSGFPTILEAYVQLFKPLNPANEYVLDLTFGQFNVPFGYEIEYSSSKRDFGERSQSENALFPGERDRGINLNFDFSNPNFPVAWKANFAVLQGKGIGTGSSDWQDFTKPKDMIGRLRLNYKSYYLGISYYQGQTYVEPVPFSSTWIDKNQDLVVDSGEVTYTQAKNSKLFDKVRHGADAQLYFDFLPFGGTALRGEYYQGFGVGSNDSRFQGFYAWLSQQITTKFGLAYRFDRWDPNARKTAKGDRVDQHDFIFHYYWDSHTRISLEYIIPKDELNPSVSGDKDRHDNVLRVQTLFVF